MLFALVMLFAGIPPAAAQGVTEQVLKTALFFKLPLFVYRSDKSPRVVVCTIGETPLDSTGEKLPEALLDGRRVELRAISGAVDAEDCEFVFIGRSEAGRLDSLLRRLAARKLVTVSDLDGFSRAGGMVEFTLRPDRSGIQVLINRKAALRQGIEFSAQLLRLAKIIE